MLVFAGIVPNSPLLFQSINRDRLDEVTKTLEGLRELSDDLYAAKPDTIILLSDSEVMYPDAFSLNVADPYTTDLSAVGDLGYHKKYHPDFSFVDALQRYSRKNSLPITLSTFPTLTSASAIPLHFLTEHLPSVRIVLLSPCALDPKTHFSLGNALKHLILDSSKRIAVIAAADTSHALTKDAPEAFHEDSLVFEEKLLDILRTKNTAGLLQLDVGLIERAKDTSYREIAMLFGVIDGMGATPSILSYEKPFGVGYLVANFSL